MPAKMSGRPEQNSSESFVPRVFRYLWAAPGTVLGLLVVLIACLTGGSAGIVQGAVEVHGGFATWFLRRSLPLLGSAAAMTLGHVILGRDTDCLDVTREHEHVHIRQYERWGPLFLPLYLSASLILWLRGRDPYLDNPFEQEAYRLAP
jgi:hypothetical protein